MPDLNAVANHIIFPTYFNEFSHVSYGILLR